MTEAADIRELYVLPLSEFTASRDRLAQQLRAEGRDDEADIVAKLRKPSVAAWALNLAARAQPDVVEQLLESHQRLRLADSNQTLHDASLLRTAAVTTLTDAAVSELQERGQAVSGQTRDRVNRTLLAVATDSQGEADLAAGTLSRELEPSGIGWGDTRLPPPPAPDPGREAVLAAEKARDTALALEAEAVAAAERVETAKQTLTEARGRARSARAAADEASRAAEAAEQAARRLSRT
jgi:hypothetical protein